MKNFTKTFKKLIEYFNKNATPGFFTDKELEDIKSLENNSKLILWDKEIENKKLKQALWEEARINLIINLRRNEKEIGEIKFIVSPSEYKDIMNLRGAHCGRLIKNDQDIIISLFPSDILIIICNDYPEVKKNFDKKYKEYEDIEFFQ